MAESHDSPDKPADNDTITSMLGAARGRPGAGNALMQAVYEQLRRAAQRQMNNERCDHTLSATALVHEAYLRLTGAREVPWAGRAQFYAAAAEAMRRILIDHARSKHGRGESGRASRQRALALSGLGSVQIHEDSDGLLALDEALIRLEGIDTQAGAVVRLRFYAGLDIEQTAKTLGVSPRTVKRDWQFARGWLRNELER